jgi:hypothetical protein
MTAGAADRCGPSSVSGTAPAPDVARRVLSPSREVFMVRFANRRNTVVFILAAAMTLVVVPSPASAQAPGVRGGVSVDPDQFYLGAHYETGPLVDRLHFKPNVEVGFGDDLTLIALNFEFVYKFPTRRAWNLYAGAGPAINIYSFDDLDDSETEPGLNFLFGAEHARGLFFELKLGAIDSPDLKFGVGWTFR